MIKRANHLLRLFIPLFLVFCSSPVVHNFDLPGVQFLEQSSTMAHFTPIAMDSAIGAADLVHRANYKYSDKDFHDALISDRISIISTTVLVCILSAFIDRFANKFGLKAISTRAPPRFTF